MSAKKSAKIIILVFSISFILIILGFLTYCLSITSGVNIDVQQLEKPKTELKIYSDDGAETSFNSTVKEYTEIDNISIDVINAFVAFEDKRFYTHNGIDYRRIFAAAVNNMKVGYSKEGGSTITQQLAKNTMLNNEKTFERKIKEYKLARQIEKRYDKNEILEMYLNAIYFGNGIYGITDASERIFAKSPSEITLPEAAMITGIVKNPRDYSPLSSPDKAKERMLLVLKVMAREGYIDSETMLEAGEYEYTRPMVQDNSHFYYENGYSDAVLAEASDILGISERDLFVSPYKIQTYLNNDKQDLSISAIKSEELNIENADKTILIADNATGGICAYATTNKACVLTFRRQPASAIKPLFVYAPALNHGYIAPSSRFNDNRTDFDGYAPSNYGDKYLGWIDVRTALSTSSNVVAVSIADELGIDFCKNYAEKFGLKLNQSDGLASALGGLTDGVTLKELTEGYMTLANGGIHYETAFVKSIINSDGREVYRHRPNQKRIISEESAYLLTDMLKDTAKNGTAKKLNALNMPIAAKTGTAGNENGNTDAYCISYTTLNTMAVWYGSSVNKPASVTGGGLPTLMTKYLRENMAFPQDFQIPNGIVTKEIDVYATDFEGSVNLASKNTPSDYRKTELFDARYVPNRVSTYFDDYGTDEYDFENPFDFNLEFFNGDIFDGIFD